jgi:phage recombination protein Bet
MNKVVPLQAVQPLRPRDYTASQLDLVKRTVAADCNSDEFSLFIEVCKRVGLDPFRRQIYAVVYNKDKPDKRKMSIITGIDGFRAVAARNGDYRPDDEEARIFYDDSLKDPAINPLGIEKAVVRAFKLAPNGQWHPVVGTAYWDEFAPIEQEYEWIETGEVWPESGKPKKEKRPTGKGKLPVTSKWRSMARVMIAKCAEAQALRKGWPEDLSGVYAPEEMARAEMEDRTAAEQVEAFQQEQRLRAINAMNTVPIQWAAGETIEFVPDGQFADRAIQFIRQASAPQINAWREINRHGLQEFWARHKADALEVKREMEARVKALESAENA